jgi:hypothetical protein
MVTRIAGEKSTQSLREGEEELLEPGAVTIGRAVAIPFLERAPPEARGDDLETGPVKRPGGRGQLSHHVGAVAALLDHLDDAADLALGPPEPPDHVGHRLTVHVHGNSLVPGMAR